MLFTFVVLSPLSIKVKTKNEAVLMCGEGGGQKWPKMGGRPLYKPPNKQNGHVKNLHFISRIQFKSDSHILPPFLCSAEKRLRRSSFIACRQSNRLICLWVKSYTDLGRQFLDQLQFYEPKIE